MKPLTKHAGRAVVLRCSDVDTDQIIPAEYCKRLTKSGYEDVLFAGWRADPDFVLNKPESAGASLLLAEHNFGTGSSREHAVWALRDWGFRVVIAASFGDIFRRNCFKNGLLAVVLPGDAVRSLGAAIDRHPDRPVTVDLEGREVRADHLRFGFSVASQARELLLRGLDEIEVTLEGDAAISAYERTRARWLPRIAPDKCLPADVGQVH
ncbi:3-isopropylmalate dehydratase small subunit [Streptomyces spectabilis]|uniref:3-isopropylmalate dehydratase small subunit n=1 Tax=Streptomyces spectabilis TaxID=68270 RepID=A0A7W8EY32_STRST|nr:3-isopropylmalate dehydratase small subunit [Streptomyces spectabilis]MBB5109707.1 3-isopropylmalate/(R)-2-methylmalate dehydratase small subunit [Streptomyces spectabilis]GGV56173.1 3-isopropylmalate dehydratase small subunit [Streptomyces spectabilis]